MGGEEHCFNPMGGLPLKDHTDSVGGWQYRNLPAGLGNGSLVLYHFSLMKESSAGKKKMLWQSYNTIISYHYMH